MLASRMLELLPQAAGFARAPVSNYRVGAVARGVSGALYFGANLEFAGCPIGFTVHAEQSAIANAWMSGERGVSALAVSSAPCGHCRQFLNELASAADLEILLPGLPSQSLPELLPDAFGPRNLGVGVGLMQHGTQELVCAAVEDDPLLAAALAAANRSYAPYTGAYAGVALRMRDGGIYSGAYAENAAFNPSLPAMQAALSQVNLAARHWSEIERAVLVQAGPSLVLQYAKTVLESVSGAPLEVVNVTSPGPEGTPEPPAA